MPTLVAIAYDELRMAYKVLLSLVNPVICAAIFTKLTQGQSRSTKIAIATKAALSIVVILCLAALVGTAG